MSEEKRVFMELHVTRRSSLGKLLAHAAQPGRSQAVFLPGAGAGAGLERALCAPDMSCWPGERHAEFVKLVCLRGRGNDTKQSEN